ncbi:hypothetical protein APHAL10511_004617 [Amanita phalloides]|nr:hypothetical protein APHAL10511_004617 [Amanita phalloides]
MDRFRTIAKELERRDRFLKLYSVWDDFLIDGELPETLIITAGRIPLDTRAVLSNIFPFEAERRVDVIVYVGDIFNIRGMNTGLQPGMPIAKALHPPLEEPPDARIRQVARQWVWRCNMKRDAR